MNLSKSYILNLEIQMKNNKLQQAYIRNIMTTWEFFFVVDLNTLNTDQHLFWNNTLDTLRKSGSQASLGDSKLWYRIYKRGGWRNIFQ